LYRGFPYLTVLFFLPLVFIQGCTRSLLQTDPASEQEFELASKAFAQYQEVSADLCGCCLDAEIDAALSVSGWFNDHTGKLTGYLQAMEPSYIKFIAINPLGQPLFILVTNGNIFKSFNVFEEKIYLGSVDSKAYKKFAPQGFDPEFSYYWLTGRLQPGEWQPRAVMRDREQDAFWLQINHAESSTDSMVLFDPEDMVLLRHVLRDARGEHLVDITYKDHLSLPGKDGKCSGPRPAAMPSSLVSSKAGAEKVEIKLHSLVGDANFSAADFQLEIPDNFEQLHVK
jgi:outer membrane lipoprotein-sorting protein